MSPPNLGIAIVVVVAAPSSVQLVTDMVIEEFRRVFEDGSKSFEEFLKMDVVVKVLVIL